MVCASIIRWQIAEWKLRKHTRLVAESRRGLFRFSDGIRIRAVDPIAVILSMEEHPDFRFDIHPKRVEEEGELEATTMMVDAIRKAFAVPEFTSPKLPGLTVQECLQLYDAFAVTWISKKKVPSILRPRRDLRMRHRANQEQGLRPICRIVV